jgi:hypothetical protein
MTQNSPNSFPEGTPLYFIQNWKNATENQSSVQELFSSSGNYFTLHTGNISHTYNTLHVYLGATFEPEQVILYAVPGLSDYSENLSQEFSRYEASKQLPKNYMTLATYVNSKLENIGLYTEDVKAKFNRQYSPEEQKLIDSIFAWNDPKTRNAWLSSLYEEGKPIVLSLDIDVSDFTIAEAHKCYLALKSVDSGYQIDLVIENTTTGAFLNLTKDPEGMTSLHDMARPVPPFGQNGSVYTQSSDQFGILGIIS